MFEPVRGGTRGGQAEFKWSDVSQDKDRENYLGHSINAPTGRWQKNKDIHWYQREGRQGDEERKEELKKIKEAEAEALASVLGFAPGPKSGSSGGVGTGANAITVPIKSSSMVDSLDPEEEESMKRKARKKEEKRSKEERRARRRREERGDGSSDREDQRRRRRSRSRSPRRRDHDRSHSPRRRDQPYDYDRAAYQSNWSRTPPRRRDADSRRYGEDARNRERDRRYWDDRARKDALGARWGSD